MLGAVRRHAPLFSAAGVDVPHVLRAASLREFADRCTRVLAGRASVEEYYSESSCLPLLQHIRVPCVCVSARDDPICDAATVCGDVRAAARASAYLVAVETHEGGHLAWMEGFGGASWLPRACGELADALLEHSRELQ
jgi:predicted alpha/beta-fold hydrolase